MCLGGYILRLCAAALAGASACTCATEKLGGSSAFLS
jgi:hypothetical protein